LPASPGFQILQALAVISMLRIGEEFLKNVAGYIRAETAMLKAFLKRTFGNVTGAPEQFAPSREATRAIGFRLPFAGAAISTAHADELHVHRSSSLLDDSLSRYLGQT
jgi:hypothetical protein